MYTAVLHAHSWLRWAVVILGLLAILAAVTGSMCRRPWRPLDDRLGLFFTIALHLQMLLGLLLYFALSPITRAAMQDFGAAMGNSGLRFWAVEHVFGMIVGLVLAHRGRSRAKTVTDPVRRHRVAAVFYALAMLAILASIPWPGTPNFRPLFRF